MSSKFARGNQDQARKSRTWDGRDCWYMLLAWLRDIVYIVAINRIMQDIGNIGRELEGSCLASTCVAMHSKV